MEKSESHAQNFGLAMLPPRGDVMTDAVSCWPDEALFGEVYVGYCWVPLNGLYWFSPDLGGDWCVVYLCCMVFGRFSL